MTHTAGSEPLPRVPPLLAAFVAAAVNLPFVGLALLGWGGWTGFMDHPARPLVVLGALVIPAVSSALGGGVGRRPAREAEGSRWVLAPVLLLGLLLAWLAPWTDRRGLWVLDHEAVRWAGLALQAIGGVLRIAAMVRLGPRFSGLVELQEGHGLETGGPYRYLRHPGYLGGILTLVGWGLAFRSAAGLLVALLIGGFLAARVAGEERFLEEAFGEEWRAYRRRTRRMVPFVW